MQKLIFKGHVLTRIFFALLVGGGLMSSVTMAAQPKAWSDNGVLLISSQGQQLGTEKFSIKADTTQILAKG